MTLTVGSLCAGIGGIEYGLELTGGFTTRWQAEIDPFARRVLAKHWPDAQRLEDVRHVSRESVPRVDLITAGLPCQPHSLAGKRESSNDQRDLWGEFARIVGDLEPRWLLVENVPGILTSSDPAFGRDYPGAYFGRILSDLAALGYDAEWECIRAADTGAPHIRNRMFLLAYPHVIKGGQRSGFDQEWRRPHETQQAGLGGSSGDVSDSHSERFQEQHPSRVTGDAGFFGGGIDEAWGTWAPEPGVGRVAYGVPDRVHRLRTLGNAVVPQVARWIGERILAAEGAA